MTNKEIISRASELGIKYLSDGTLVDLNKIIKELDIPIISGFINSSIPGSLICKDNKFYIILNSNPKASSDPKRHRFTIAHELGHFFIDHHKEELLKGNSLFVGEVFEDSVIKKWEKEADKFAVNLLMPARALNNYINNSTLTIGLIEEISEKFQVSTECAALSLIDLSPKEQVLIKWRYKSNNYSSSSKILHNNLKSINKSKLIICTKKIEESEEILKKQMCYQFNKSTLSDWFSSLTIEDYPYIFSTEATLNEGFGGMVLLTRD
jgi:Zn-dependent peptidase ImmA (M78 family)